MFKNVLHILIFLLVIALLNSCASENKNEAVNATIVSEEEIDSSSAFNDDEINLNNLPNKLSPNQQKAYQLRAKQKFQDFLDYLKIVTNPKLNDDLVNHSEDLLKELFISDSVTIYDKDSILYELFGQNSSIKLLNLLENKKLEAYRYEITSKIDSYKFTSPLERDSTNIFYYGKLEADIVLNKQKTNKTVDIYLVETTKEFGEEKLKTVEIKLGNIY